MFFAVTLFIGSGWILIICFHTNRSMICCFKEGDYHLIELRARTFFDDNLRFSCSYKRAMAMAHTRQFDTDKRMAKRRFEPGPLPLSLDLTDV